MQLTLLGQVPAQKNDKIIAINKRTGKRFPMTSAAVKGWKEDVAMQIFQKNLGGYSEPVVISYEFYVRDNRKRDIDNMICTVNDALAKSHIIIDDSWQHLQIGFATAQIDKENPRVELWITPRESA